MGNEANRRPLKVRDWGIIQSTARRLSRQNITPNHISVASIAFSAWAAFFLLKIPTADFFQLVLLALAVTFGVLGRALCNIFDGMVAVEGGKSTPSGELFNDIPDRISDTLMLVAAGYAVGGPWGEMLGWAAALMAMGTAYARTLGRSLGAPTDFQGPMAKTHRMVVIVVACLIAPFWYTALLAGLVVIIIGCALTIWNRVFAAYRYLERGPHV
ncbi:MAG: CDP-alcohol phosphatidyltransferase family protein [Proteobacteria bacterium]|nr:CDP-alcohol phosphatidyltransferase family protein [Pseudomonadota bacterium]